ncbi:MAG TPA: GAF domain-containing protein [Candidatus Deferrimicrobiaceae bacterium]|nr:GAF domain-containing protein [Candidatus Deferrimicrobiaceae bacterium]
MANDGTELPPDFARDFPFESRLSLAPLIRYWDEQAKDPSLCGEMARSLQARVHRVPALLAPIDDITVLDEHGELVDALMGAVFPPVFWDQAYMGALIPFTLRTVYGTRAFESIMGADGVLYGRLNLEMSALKDFRLLNAYALILERLHGIKFPVDYPLILTMPEPETGLDRHFKIQFDGRFVDVEAVRPLPPLSDETRKRLTAQGVDLDGLKALIPPGSVRFSGFTVVKASDVTDQEVLSSIKRDLIDKESIVSNARFEKLQAKLRTLFRRANLHLTLVAFESDRILMLNSGHQLQQAQGCIFAGSAHGKMADFAGSVYERASLRGEPIFIEDLAALTTRSSKEEAILRKGMRSLVVAPLHYQRELIGMLSLSSPIAGDVNALLAPRLQEVLPLFSVAVKRSVDELHSRVEGFIKEQFTAIHPVVEWRFRKAVLEGMERGAEGEDKPAGIEPIVFRDVHPLYAVSDIRGSSTHRAWAIQADLLTQLGLAREVLRAAYEVRPRPILDQLTHRIDGHTAEIEVTLRSGDEMGVLVFLKTDLEPLFGHLQTFGPTVHEKIDAYRAAVDPGIGLVYARRKEFDESVTRINEAVSSYIDLEEQAAQGMFPHFFEKQKTDGVDYTIYLGGALREDGVFDPLYLKNMRLWQLMVACGVALRVERLKDRLPVRLDITNLILIQHAPLSIRFRADEKRFDVDGAYNVRYEIIKKRIDKAILRGTTERLTQPGKIALVYSHPSEAAEWREYIEYLQRLGYLTRDVEELELDELQGAQGLRALRVAVDLTNRELDVPSTATVTALPRADGESAPRA